MSTRRAAVAVLAVTAVAGAGVAAGVVLTRGGHADAGASSAPSATTVEAAVPAADALPQPTEPAPVIVEPGDGQAVATDEPLIVTGAEVPVTITYAGWNADAGAVEVAGYVAGIVESGGSCTLTLSRDGRSVTGRTEALPDAATTSCAGVMVPGDQVSDGTWQAVLSYSSADHNGTSGSVDVEVAR